MTPALTPALTAALAAAGQRVTRHRRAVITALSSADRPLTADELSQQSGAPPSTTYRNLADLCDLGICVRVNGTERTDRYELAEQFTDRHHHHLVCAECGAVTDFDPGAALERAIRNELQALPARFGFRPASHVFDVVGRCSECASAAGPVRRPGG